MEGKSPSVTALRVRLHDAEQNLRFVRARLEETEHRARLAEKAARDAWAFARATMHRPTDYHR